MGCFYLLIFQGLPCLGLEEEAAGEINKQINRREDLHGGKRVWVPHVPTPKLGKVTAEPKDQFPPQPFHQLFMSSGCRHLVFII